MALSEAPRIPPPPSAAPSVPASGLTPAELLSRLGWVLGKHRWMALLSALVVIAAGVTWTWSQPRLYTAKTTLLVHPSAPRVLDKIREVQNESVGGGQAALEKYYNTQLDIVTGKSVAEIVVRARGLD